MKRTLLLLLFIYIFIFPTYSQILGYDTLNVLQYNLMMYNGPGIECTPPNATVRARYLATILDFAKPDVFGVNEMYPSDATADLILDSAVNVHGRTDFKRASLLPQSGDITNMIFYNSRKLNLISTTSINCQTRNATLYTFNHLGTATGVIGKGIQSTLTFIVVHLKASNTTTDAEARGVCAQNIMSSINSKYPIKGNYFVMGDFNLYTSTEPAFLNFTNTTSGIYFNDPAKKIGAWSNNASFTSVHSQSTRLSSGSECFSAGGNDDRFDFIMANNEVINGTQFVKYIDQSYKVIGQSGTIFNKDVTDPSNTSAPSSVLGALFGMSDHLPVSLKLRITLSTISSDLLNNDYSNVPSIFTGDFSFANPNITIKGLFNTVSGIYATSGTNSITISGLNTYVLSSDGTSMNMVSFTGNYTISGSKMTISLKTFNKANIVSPEIDNSILPNPLKGNSIANGSSITIINSTNTVSGIYSFSNPNMTLIGSNTYSKSDQSVGINYVTIVGLATFTGSNISLTTSNTIYSTVPGVPTSISASANALELNIINPFGETLSLYKLKNGKYEVVIYDMLGQLHLSDTFEVDNQFSIVIPTQSFPLGTYILAIKEQNGLFHYKKIVKQ